MANIEKPNRGGWPEGVKGIIIISESLGRCPYCGAFISLIPYYVRNCRNCGAYWSLPLPELSRPPRRLVKTKKG